MRKWQKWLIVLFTFLLLIGIGYIVANFLFLNFFIESKWFASLGYEGYFYERLLYRYGTFGVIFLVFFTIFFINFWVASRYIGKKTAPTDQPQEGNSYIKVLTAFRLVSMRFYAPISALLAFWIALPFFEQWEQALLYFFSPQSGVTDPVYHKDISYYLFSFPIYKTLQGNLLTVFIILFVCLVLLYLIERNLLSKNEHTFPVGAKIHLTLLILFLIGIQAWGFLLQRYDLLYVSSHSPHFYGPGFVELNIERWIVWADIIFFSAAGLLLVNYIHRKTALKTFLVVMGCFLLTLWAQQTAVLQNIIDRLYIQSNIKTAETPFIINNIVATKNAYNLTEVETKDYPIKDAINISSNPKVAQSIRNVPVWDRELLNDVYNQRQGLWNYYSFKDIDVDRYKVNNLYQQVYLGARELNYNDIPEKDRTWDKTHLKYTHGYGVVMTPAIQGGEESMIWFVGDIPPKSDYGITVKRPEIYYGYQMNDYVIVPNDFVGDLGKKGESSEENGDKYDGTGGIRFSLLNKIMLAAHFDWKILYTQETNSDSRLLFRRNVTKRIKHITPYFMLDHDPYLVIGKKGLFWIQDAYTYSNRYPNSEPYRTGNHQFNYIRNSVKIVVDTYNGSVRYYVSDPHDPIIVAYRRIYPSLFRDLKDMPQDLKQHLRYPKDIFEIQMHIYAKYHTSDPEMFYSNEDLWESFNLTQNNRSYIIRPYYLTLNLFNPKQPEFMLMHSFKPKSRNKNNLRALAIARCDGKNYGKLFVYKFSNVKQVNGPTQVSTLIDQDTEISQQLTLWDQAGSEVIRGRMITLPIDGLVLYIQPVYLSSSTQLKIPELKRLIVSQGTTVAMASSLEEAFEKLERKMKERIERQKKRFTNGPAKTPEKPKPQPKPQKEEPAKQPKDDTLPEKTVL